MAIRVIVEFQAKPGTRAELVRVLDDLMARLGPSLSGFLGSTLHEVLDTPDTLVEIADWESAEAQAAAVAQAMGSGVYAPVFELLAAPLKATRIQPLGEEG